MASYFGLLGVPGTHRVDRDPLFRRPRRRQRPPLSQNVGLAYRAYASCGLHWPYWEPVAHDLELLSVYFGLLWGAVARYFELLGLPGGVELGVSIDALGDYLSKAHPKNPASSAALNDNLESQAAQNKRALYQKAKQPKRRGHYTRKPSSPKQ